MDDLEADIRAAMAGTDAPATPAAVEGVAPAVIPDAAPAPAVAEAPKDDGRARDDQGRFKPKEGEAAAPAAEAKPVDPKAAAQPVAAAPDATKQAQAIPPPSNWKGAGKVAWDKLPEPIRRELSEDYTRNAQTQARLDRLDATITPERTQVLSATYGSVEQGLQNLFAISDLATKNPQGFLLWFAQQRGINLAQMVGQPGAQGEQPMQQAPDPVMQRLGQVETFLTNFVQQQQQSAQAPIIAEINRFAADPAHPYFKDVEDDIMDRLKTGRVPGSSPSERLQNAYEQAIWAHPEIKNTLIDGRVSQRLEEQSAAATRAQNAAVSVSGSPAGAKIASEEPDDDLETVIRKAQRAASGS